MAKLQATSNSINPYETAKAIYAGSPLYSAVGGDETWNTYAKNGKLNTLVALFNEQDKLNGVATLQDKYTGYDLLSNDEKISAAANELWADRETLNSYDIRTKDIDGNYITDDNGDYVTEPVEMTEYDYYKYVLSNRADYYAEVEAMELEAERKANMNGFVKFLSSLGSIGMHVGFGALDALYNLANLATAGLDGVAELLGGNLTDKSFRELMGTSSVWSDWLTEFDAKYSTLTDDYGNYTTIGSFVVSMANSIGQMLPFAFGTQALTGVGVSTKVAGGISGTMYFTSLGVSHLQDYLNDPNLQSVATWKLVAMSAVEAGLEAIVTLCMNRFMGGTILDSLTFGSDAISTTVTQELIGKSFSAKGVSAVATRIVKAAFKEGVEEAFQEYSTYFVNYIASLYNDKFETYAQYDVTDMVTAFALGFISTGITESLLLMSTPRVNTNTVATDKQGNVKTKWVYETDENGKVVRDDDGKKVKIEVPVYKKFNAIDSLNIREALNKIGNTYNDIIKSNNMDVKTKVVQLQELTRMATTLGSIYNGIGDVHFQNALRILDDMQKVATQFSFESGEGDTIVGRFGPTISSTDVNSNIPNSKMFKMSIDQYNELQSRRVTAYKTGAALFMKEMQAYLGDYYNSTRAAERAAKAGFNIGGSNTDTTTPAQLAAGEDLSNTKVKNKSKAGQNLLDLFTKSGKNAAVVVEDAPSGSSFTEGDVEFVSKNDLDRPANDIIADQAINNLRDMIKYDHVTARQDRAIASLNKLYRDINKLSDDEDVTDNMISALFTNANGFLDIAMQHATKDVYEFISVLDKIVDNIDNKPVMGKELSPVEKAIYGKKYGDLLGNISRALTEFLKLHFEADFEQLTILSDDQKEDIRRARIGYAIKNRIETGTGTEQDFNLLRTLVNNTNVDEGTKKTWLADIDAAEEYQEKNGKPFTTAINRIFANINAQYPGKFNNVYDGITYLPETSVANSVFNVWLMSVGLTFEQFRTMQPNNTDPTTIPGLMDSGFYFDNDMVHYSDPKGYLKTQFEAFTNDTYTYVEYADNTYRVTTKDANDNYIENKQDFTVDRNVNFKEDNYFPTSIYTDYSNFMSDLTRDDISPSIRAQLTINDLIVSPAFLSTSVLEDIIKTYGKITTPNVISYIQQKCLSSRKPIALVVMDTGEYALVNTTIGFTMLTGSATLKTLKNLVKPNKSYPISMFIQDKFLLGKLKETKIKFVDTKGGDPAKYVKNTNTIVMDVGYIENPMNFNGNVFTKDLLHEFNHAIQVHNNIGMGTSPKPLSVIPDNQLKNRDDMIADIVNHNKNYFNITSLGIIPQDVTPELVDMTNQYLYDSAAGELYSYGLVNFKYATVNPTIIHTDDTYHTITFVFPWSMSYTFTVDKNTKLTQYSKADMDGDADIRSSNVPSPNGVPEYPTVQVDRGVPNALNPNTKWANTNKTSRYLTYDVVKGTNLELLYNAGVKLLDTDLQKFIISSELREIGKQRLDATLVQWIEDGSIRKSHGEHSIRYYLETARSMDEYTFSQIKKYFYPNCKVASFEALKDITEVNSAARTYSILRMLRDDIEFAEGIDPMDYIVELANNPEVSTSDVYSALTEDQQRKAYTYEHNYLKNMENTDMGNLRKLLMDRFDGTAGSLLELLTYTKYIADQHLDTTERKRTVEYDDKRKAAQSQWDKLFAEKPTTKAQVDAIVTIRINEYAETHPTDNEEDMRNAFAKIRNEIEELAERDEVELFQEYVKVKYASDNIELTAESVKASNPTLNMKQSIVSYINDALDAMSYNDIQVLLSKHPNIKIVSRKDKNGVPRYRIDKKKSFSTEDGKPLSNEQLKAMLDEAIEIKEQYASDTVKRERYNELKLKEDKSQEEIAELKKLNKELSKQNKDLQQINIQLEANKSIHIPVIAENPIPKVFEEMLQLTFKDTRVTTRNFAVDLYMEQQEMVTYSTDVVYEVIGDMLNTLPLSDVEELIDFLSTSNVVILTAGSNEDINASKKYLIIEYAILNACMKLDNIKTNLSIEYIQKVEKLITDIGTLSGASMAYLRALEQSINPYRGIYTAMSKQAGIEVNEKIVDELAAIMALPLSEQVYVEQKDAQGNIVKDDKGNPILVPKKDAQGNPVYKNTITPAYAVNTLGARAIDINNLSPEEVRELLIAYEIDQLVRTVDENGNPRTVTNSGEQIYLTETALLARKDAIISRYRAMSTDQLMSEIRNKGMSKDFWDAVKAHVGVDAQLYEQEIDTLNNQLQAIQNINDAQTAFDKAYNDYINADEFAGDEYKELLNELQALEDDLNSSDVLTYEEHDTRRRDIIKRHASDVAPELCDKYLEAGRAYDAALRAYADFVNSVTDNGIDTLAKLQHKLDNAMSLANKNTQVEEVRKKYNDNDIQELKQQVKGLRTKKQELEKQISDINAITQKADKVITDINNAKRELTTLQNTVSGLEQSIASAEDTLVFTENRQTQWWDEHGDRYTELDDKYDVTNPTNVEGYDEAEYNEYKALDNELTLITNNLKQLKQNIKNNKAKLGYAQQAFNTYGTPEYSKLIQSYKDKQTAIKQQMDAIPRLGRGFHNNDDRLRYQSLQNQYSAYGNVLQVLAIPKQIKLLKQRIDTLTKQHKGYIQSYDEAQTRGTALTEELKLIEGQIHELQQTIDDYNYKPTQDPRTFNLDTINKLKQQIHDVQSQLNEYSISTTDAKTTNNLLAKIQDKYNKEVKFLQDIVQKLIADKLEEARTKFIAQISTTDSKVVPDIAQEDTDNKRRLQLIKDIANTKRSILNAKGNKSSADTLPGLPKPSYNSIKAEESTLYNLSATELKQVIDTYGDKNTTYVIADTPDPIYGYLPTETYEGTDYKGFSTTKTDTIYGYELAKRIATAKLYEANGITDEMVNDSKAKYDMQQAEFDAEITRLEAELTSQQQELDELKAKRQSNYYTEITNSVSKDIVKFYAISDIQEYVQNTPVEDLLYQLVSLSTDIQHDVAYNMLANDTWSKEEAKLREDYKVVNESELTQIKKDISNKIHNMSDDEVYSDYAAKIQDQNKPVVVTPETKINMLGQKLMDIRDEIYEYNATRRLVKGKRGTPERKKGILQDITKFQQLCMLSSPSTWIRNWTSNFTLYYANLINTWLGKFVTTPFKRHYDYLLAEKVATKTEALKARVTEARKKYNKLAYEKRKAKEVEKANPWKTIWTDAQEKELVAARDEVKIAEKDYKAASDKYVYQITGTKETDEAIAISNAYFVDAFYQFDEDYEKVRQAERLVNAEEANLQKRKSDYETIKAIYDEWNTPEGKQMFKTGSIPRDEKGNPIVDVQPVPKNNNTGEILEGYDVDAEYNSMLIKLHQKVDEAERYYNAKTIAQMEKAIKEAKVKLTKARAEYHAKTQHPTKSLTLYDLVGHSLSRYFENEKYFDNVKADETNWDELATMIYNNMLAEALNAYNFGVSADTEAGRRLQAALNLLGRIVAKFTSDEKWIKKEAMKLFPKMLTERGLDKVASDNPYRKEVMEVFAEAYCYAAWEFMHRPNALNKIEETMSQYPTVYFIWKQIFPFLVSSLNWVSAGITYSPYGIVKGVTGILNIEKRYNKNQQKYEQTHGRGMNPKFTLYESYKELGNGIMGTIFAAIGIGLAAAGLAAIDKEDDQVKIKFGDSFYIDVSGVFGSSGLLMGMTLGTAIIEAFADGLTFNTALDIIIQLCDALLMDTSFASMYQQISFSDSFGDYLMSLVVNFLGKFIPNAWKTLSTWINSSIAETDYESDTIGSLEYVFTTIIPGISAALPKQYNIYTGELEHTYKMPWLFEALNKFSPVDIDYYDYSDMELLAMSLGLNKGQLTGRYEDIGNLTTTQVSLLNQMYGKLNKQLLAEFVSGKTSYKVEDANGNYVTLKYNKMTDKQKKSVVNRIMTNNASYAKIYVYTNYMGGKYYATDDMYDILRKLGIRKGVYKETSKLSGFN